MAGRPMKVIHGDFHNQEDDLQTLMDNIHLSIELLPDSTPLVSVIGVLEIVKANILSQLDNDA
jgi:hypothetical protein